jgi:phage baseplate assembly protein W
VADLLGTDLAVAPHLAAHDASLLDLSGALRPPAGRLADGATEARDLATVSGRENLAHALVLRLLTPTGSLGGLGHAAYGSRLHELVGRRKTEELRNLCRAFVLEAVAQEGRVEPKAVAFRFLPEAETASSFVFEVAVRPVDGGEPLDVALQVGL